MVFYIFSTIVFIAEIIITISILWSLYHWDKIFKKSDEFLADIKPQIKEIASLYRQISEKFVEISPIIVNNIKNTVTNFVINQSKSILTGILTCLVSKHIEKIITNKIKT